MNWREKIKNYFSTRVLSNIGVNKALSCRKECKIRKVYSVLVKDRI